MNNVRISMVSGLGLHVDCLQIQNLSRATPHSAKRCVAYPVGLFNEQSLGPRPLRVAFCILPKMMGRKTCPARYAVPLFQHPGPKPKQNVTNGIRSIQGTNVMVLSPKCDAFLHMLLAF